MNEDERNASSQSPEERNVSAQRNSGESESSRYRFIMYCGLEKENNEES